MPLWAAQKWLFHSTYFCDWDMIKDVFREFLRCKHLMEKMRNLFLWSQCFNIIFPIKSKKEDTIYMEIIYMSFLLRNLLRKNIYTMLSFMWSHELLSILTWWLYLYWILFFTFLRYEVSYSKNIKIFRTKPELIFPITFQTIFCRTYFCDFRPKSQK